MANKKWILHQYENSVEIEMLKNTLHVPEPLCNMFLQRGLKNEQDIRNFFRPPFPQGVIDPFLMQDMLQAIQRIETGVKEQHKLLIYGDYDVDGTTAVAMLYLFFKTYFQQIDFYVPDRVKEGYGISRKAIQWASEQGFSLIIALDCGIRSFESIHLARQYGIDVIVCDHHLPDETLPPAYAVLDPKRKDCPYPYKDLSGCGVGFKLIQAFAQRNAIPFQQICLYWDLLALSIAADVVPMTGENRLFLYYGLMLVNQKPRKSFERMFVKGGLAHRKDEYDACKGTVFNKKIDVYDLIFGLAPRINAAGRIESAFDAVRLLIAEDEAEIDRLCSVIETYNVERKNLDVRITAEAAAMFLEKPEHQSQKSLIAYHPQWNKGVIGIVASRLVEQFYKPTLVLTLSEGMIVGSGRSVRGFDIHQALANCQDLLHSFGGHTAAVGLTLLPEHVDAFKEKFENVVRQTIQPHSLVASLDIAAQIHSWQDIDMVFYQTVKRFAPFGTGNPSPIFLTANVRATNDSRILKETHLKMRLYQESAPRIQFDAIAFEMASFLPQIQQGKPFHICYQIELNNWRDMQQIQLNVKDIKFEPDGWEVIIHSDPNPNR